MMRLTRAAEVASVFMMIICAAESKPQQLSAADQLLLDQLEGVPNQSAPAAKSGNCQHTCVPIDECNDPRPSTPRPSTGTGVFAIGPGIATERQNSIVDIGDRQNSQCGSPLKICCQNRRPKAPAIPSTPRSNGCGIRNTNGIRVTVMGFKDGQAQYGEFPWMVGVFLAQNDEYVGGASLVHPRVVLTAGHKIQDRGDASLVARMGDWDIANQEELIPAQNIKVEKVVFHPEFYRAAHEYNLALLILEKDVSLSDNVLPVCLPEPGQLFDGLDCIVTGWGKDKLGGEYQTVMKAATVPGLSDSRCQELLRNTRLGGNFTLHTSFNCAGGNKEDACEGDGGSPLVCPNTNNNNNPNQPQYVQMGIVSWGIGCGIPNNPGVYVSIPKTTDWIRKTIEGEQFASLIDERIVG